MSNTGFDALNTDDMMSRADQVRQKQMIDELRSRLTPGKSDDQKLREAVQGFEAIFLKQMWTQMRATVPQSGLLKSKEEQFYQSMFDHEITQSLSKSGGLGLGDMLYEELKKRTDKTAVTTSPSSMQNAYVQPIRQEHDGIALRKDEAGIPLKNKNEGIPLYEPLEQAAQAGDSSPDGETPPQPEGEPILNAQAPAVPEEGQAVDPAQPGLNIVAGPAPEPLDSTQPIGPGVAAPSVLTTLGSTPSQIPTPPAAALPDMSEIPPTPPLQAVQTPPVQPAEAPATLASAAPAASDLAATDPAEPITGGALWSDLMPRAGISAAPEKEREALIGRVQPDRHNKASSAYLNQSASWEAVSARPDKWGPAAEPTVSLDSQAGQTQSSPEAASRIDALASKIEGQS